MRWFRVTLASPARPTAASRNTPLPLGRVRRPDRAHSLTPVTLIPRRIRMV
jgi:hypothetical protein